MIRHAILISLIITPCFAQDAEVRVGVTPQMWRDLAPRGFLLLAHPDESIDSVYTDIYQGVTPPPFPMIEALNPDPKPGGVLVLPPPRQGWNNH